MNEGTAIKQAIIDAAQRFRPDGLGVGTAGNISVRSKKGFFITPSGVPYSQLQVEHILELNMEGDVLHGHLQPSSEWRIHRDIYQHRDDAGSIVHAHSPFATALSCRRQGIPAFHYVVAIAGGNSIRCADYATFGTEALSQFALVSLEDRKACLLANHGMIAFDRDLVSAFNMALEVEELAKQYTYCLQLGEPVLLDEQEMATILEKFKTYKQHASNVTSSESP